MLEGHYSLAKNRRQYRLRRFEGLPVRFAKHD